VVLAALTEVSLRSPFVRRHLADPEPTLWHAPFIHAKLDYLQSFHRKHAIKTLFMGNSTVQTGIDPVIFDKARDPTFDRADSFNAAIEGLPPASMALFLKMYLSSIHPDVIVYGLTPQDLNSNSPWAQDMDDRVSRSPRLVAETDAGLDGRATRFLLTNSMLFRYRHVLHEFLLSGGSPVRPEVPYFDRRGFHSIDATLAALDGAARKKLIPRASLVNYSVEGKQREHLLAILRMARERKIRVVLLNMPLSADYYKLGFSESAERLAYIGALRSIAADQNVLLIDPGKELGLTDSDFADLNHLNRAGASKLSEWLGAEFCRGEARCSPQAKN